MKKTQGPGSLGFAFRLAALSGGLAVVVVIVLWRCCEEEEWHGACSSNLVGVVDVDGVECSFDSAGCFCEVCACVGVESVCGVCGEVVVVDVFFECSQVHDGEV